MALAETGVKSSGYAARTSVELTAAELTAAGMAAGNALVIIVTLERAKAISVALATGAMVAEQKEIGGVRWAAFYVASWNGTTAIKATWEGSASTGSILNVQGWSGQDTTTPMDATAVWGTFSASASAIAPTITTVTAEAVQGALVSGNLGTAVGTSPEGWTRYGEFFFSRPRPTAGVTGTTTFTLTGSDTGITLTFAIRPKAEGKTVELKAAITSASTVVASLQRTRLIRSAITSVSTISAKLSRVALIKAAIASVSTIAAKLETSAAGKVVELRAAITSASTVSAKLTRTRMLRAAISSASTVAAKLTRTRLLHASIFSVSSVAARLEVSEPTRIHISDPTIFPVGIVVELYRDPHIGDLFDLGYGTAPVTRFLGSPVTQATIGEDEAATFTDGVEEDVDYLAVATVAGEERLVRVRLSG